MVYETEIKKIPNTLEDYEKTVRAMGLKGFFLVDRMSTQKGHPYKGSSPKEHSFVLTFQRIRPRLPEGKDTE